MDKIAQKPIRRSRRRRAVLAVAAVLAAVAGVMIALWAPSGPQPLPLSFDGDSQGLKQTQILPTLDTTIEAGKNAVWCASFPLAWRELRKAVGDYAVDLTGAVEVCARLNAAPDFAPDLPPGSFYAKAGQLGKGVAQTINLDLKSRFPNPPSVTFPSGPPQSLAAYAYLQTEQKFPLAYFASSKAVTFTDSSGAKTPIHTFGIGPENHKVREELREQA